MRLADKFPESLPAFQKMFPDDELVVVIEKLAKAITGKALDKLAEPEAAK